MSELTEHLDAEQRESLQLARQEVQELMAGGDFTYDEVEEILLNYGFEMDYLFEVID